MARKRLVLPDELSKKVPIPMQPEMHRAAKIAALTEGFDTVGEWLNEHLSRTLAREDLSLRAHDTASAT